MSTSSKASTPSPINAAQAHARHRAHVFFAEGSAALRARSRELLGSIASWLYTAPHRRITLFAHANAMSRRPYAARDLAFERLNKVREALKRAGVNDTQLDDSPTIALHLQVSQAQASELALCRRVDVVPLPEDEPDTKSRRRGGVQVKAIKKVAKKTAKSGASAGSKPAVAAKAETKVEARSKVKAEAKTKAEGTTKTQIKTASAIKSGQTKSDQAKVRAVKAPSTKPGLASEAKTRVEPALVTKAQPKALRKVVTKPASVRLASTKPKSVRPASTKPATSARARA